MKISFKNIPMFLTGGVALPDEGVKKTGILKFDPVGNNIWFADENLNGYHTWHANNIVNPWLESYQNPETVDWETYIKEGLDSWNEAGGFDWLKATPEQRKHRMTHENVFKHLLLIHNKYPGIDEQNKSHIDLYNYPENPITTDAWRGEEWAPDSDFGIHTGNRRPSIHTDSDTKSTKKWDDYYKKLGYLGAYKYLDHWIPTKDKAKATRIFGEVNTPDDKKKSSNDIPEGHRKYGFDWNKLGKSLNGVLNNPDFFATGRLLGSLINNERVYDEALKAINPDLLLTYRTHRQVVGDEATKQAYYRRAAAGETRAARPFTSDADRQIAYRNEVKATGDELRAKGDLADNLEIRRTSDESNLHEWANALRATEVENTNRTSINKANAMKHNLLAQKHTALWTSIDEYAQGMEYRKRLQIEEMNALADKAYLLQMSVSKYEDDKYKKAYDEYASILKKHTDENNIVDENDPEVVEAKKKWKIFNAQYEAEQYRKLIDYKRNRNRSLMYAKEGSKVKITHKKKDDLLYKSARDSVEHFIKMSKISSDALNRKEVKIKKLAPHPKGSTKKYLLGGVAPFYIYKPVALGGETTTSTQSDTSNTTSSKSEKSEGQDLLKDLFKNLNIEGLPSDVNKVFSQIRGLLLQRELFGEELSTLDITSIYMSAMQKLSNIKFNKGLFDKTLETANNKDALGEYALDNYGRVAVLNYETGEIDFKKFEELEDLKGNYSLLTNEDLLNLRAHSSNYAFNYKILELVNNNGIGMTKIAEFLKNNMSDLGSSEKTLDGYTKHETDQIREGFELLKEAPAGDYKFKSYTKELQLQAQMAIRYLQTILPRNMRNVLDLHAKMKGSSTGEIIKILVGSTLDENSRLEYDAVTGKGAKNADGTSKSGGTDTPSVVLFLLGNGNQELIEFNLGNSQSIKALGRFGVLLDNDKNNLGQGKTFLDVSGSLFGHVLDLSKATFGGARLNPGGYSHVIINSPDVASVELPVKTDQYGNQVPNFLLLVLIEKAEEEISNNRILDKRKINSIYLKYGLPLKYDSNGNIIQQHYKRFAAILVTLDSKAIKGGTPLNSNEVLQADDEERKLFIETMQSNGHEDYDLDDGFLWTSWGKDILYKGTVFIPVREDLVGGFISGGEPLDSDLPNNTNKLEMMQHTRILEYNPVANVSQLKNKK